MNRIKTGLCIMTSLYCLACMLILLWGGWPWLGDGIGLVGLFYLMLPAVKGW